MSSSPSVSPPNQSDKPGGLVILVAVVAAALTLAGVVALGWMTSSTQRAAMSATTWRPFVDADDSWSDGSHQVWSAQIPKNAEIVVAEGYVVAIERESSAGRNATLTGYSVSDSGASQVWTTNADLAAGTTATPPFQVWNGSTLVHGTTLVDLATGTVSSAPWSDKDLPLVLEDRVITCSGSGSCSGWAPGNVSAVWTASYQEAPNTSTDNALYQYVYHRGNARYAYLGDHLVVNIDTGEALSFAKPTLLHWGIWPAADGWTIMSVDDTGTNWHMYEYDVEGGNPTGDYVGTSPVGDNEDPLSSRSPRTRQHFREMWTDGVLNGIVGSAYRSGDSHGCYERFQAVDGPSIEIPTIAGDGASNVISQTSSSCAKRVGMDSDNRTATVYMQTRPAENAFAFMYNSATGEAISFDGVDVMSGDQLSLVTERLVVGYDTDTGTLYGYTPAD